MLLCKASVEDDKIIKMVILVLVWFWKTESWSLSSSVHNLEHVNSTGILIERPFFHFFKIDDVEADNILYIWLCPWVFFLVSIYISDWIPLKCSVSTGIGCPAFRSTGGGLQLQSL